VKLRWRGVCFNEERGKKWKSREEDRRTLNICERGNDLFQYFHRDEGERLVLGNKGMKEGIEYVNL
jgi:hypothetical protein